MVRGSFIIRVAVAGQPYCSDVYVLYVCYNFQATKDILFYRSSGISNSVPNLDCTNQSTSIYA